MPFWGLLAVAVCWNCCVLLDDKFAEKVSMKYCLFCRDSFEDDVKTCPYCGGELTDRLPEPDDDGPDDAGDLEAPPRDIADEPEPDASFQGPLVPVVIVNSEDDLRAAVDVLKEHGIYFEIDQADPLQKVYGLTTGRTWRLLVREDEGPDAFLKLVKALPGLFPREIVQNMEEDSQESDESSLAAARVVEIIQSPSAEKAGGELARAIMTAFAGDDSDGIARAKFYLARKGAAVVPLLREIAAQAAENGGDGSERVLFNSLEILEALGDRTTLERLEPLYASAAPQVRSRAAYAAGRLGAAEAVDGLLELLTDEDEDVRYEASESIWRLTGLDFDFDPYLPVGEQLQQISALRDAWAKSAKTGAVRNRVDLSAILRAMGEDD